MRDSELNDEGVKIAGERISNLRYADDTALLADNYDSMCNVLNKVMMYGSEAWTMKSDEVNKIEAAELWFYHRLLRVSWTDKRTNESIRQSRIPREYYHQR